MQYLWDTVVILAIGLIALPAVAALRSSRVSKWIPAATPEALGAIRAWIALILLASVIWEDIASTAWLPRSMLVNDLWIIRLLSSLPIGFDRMLVSETGLHLFEGVTMLVIVMAMVGLFTRWTVPAAAFGYLIIAAILRSYAWTYHTGVIPLYAMLILSFTPCGDGLSVDRWLRKRKGKEVAPARVAQLQYGIGRYLVWMVIAIPYTMAGLSKVRRSGLLWWRSDYMEERIIATVLEPMHFNYDIAFRLLGGPRWLWGAMGLAAIVAEVVMVLVLVSPLMRKVLPAVTAAMHVAILFMQNILFPDLIAIQAVFYDWKILSPRGVADVEPEDGRAWRWTRRQALVAQGFVLLAFGAWASRTENFPLTAMQMFSRSRAPQPVQYVRPVVRYADGSVEQARFERWIWAMADSRYRWLLRDWDKHPERIDVLKQFLDVAAARSAMEGKPVREFDMDVRTWDYMKDPRDPRRGKIMYVLKHVPRPPATPRA